MQKWEYSTLMINFFINEGELTVNSVNAKNLRPPVTIGAYLTRLGQLGWEIAGQSQISDQVLYTFRRPKQS
jgi:hypothetical protein